MKELERDLGLYSVFTISIGAMIGSGLFVLPGIASTIAGPAVIVAYPLAGLLVLPAALSKAEMATALPESGGTYLFIDRSMGPLLGTIAGIGTWFSLVFKSAFALVGLGAYLVLFADLPVKPVALGLALLLVGLNILGVKQTGRFQAVLVTGVLAVLVFLVGRGVGDVDRANLEPFFAEGIGGLLAATGFVFVSYGGVTKIASVAEEVEDPGRNLPAGILGSLLLMMVIYTSMVLVVVGVTTRETLGKTLTPMADAAAQYLGPVGEVLVAVTAVLALTSMANAGVLSSSRYPFAMSLDRLMPEALGRINSRFRTPAMAIVATGVPLMLLIAFVPVVELAKLASAFKILVFCLVNVALIVLRRSDPEWYVPEFRAPGYPWVQLFGIAGGLVLLPLMGWLPILGAVGIVGGGLAWYRWYGRHGITREGEVPRELRRATDEHGLRRTEEALEAIAGETSYRVLVAVRRGIEEGDERALVTLGSHLAAAHDGELLVVRFEEVPDQVTLGAAALEVSIEDTEFEARVERWTADLDVPSEAREIVTHNLRRALVNFARREGADAILGEWREGFRRWLLFHAPCNLIFVRPRELPDIESIAVLADRGPHDPLEVATAEAVARRTGAGVVFLYGLPSDAPEGQEEAIAAYHEELAELSDVRSESRIVTITRDRVEELIPAGDSSDLVIVGASAHRWYRDVVFGDLPDKVASRSACTVMLVHAPQPHRQTFWRWIVEKISYR